MPTLLCKRSSYIQTEHPRELSLLHKLEHVTRTLRTRPNYGEAKRLREGKSLTSAEFGDLASHSLQSFFNYKTNT